VTRWSHRLFCPLLFYLLHFVFWFFMSRIKAYGQKKAELPFLFFYSSDIMLILNHLCLLHSNSIRLSIWSLQCIRRLLIFWDRRVILIHQGLSAIQAVFSPVLRGLFSRFSWKSQLKLIDICVIYKFECSSIVKWKSKWRIY